MRPIDEPRIYRQFAIPLSAFDALKRLQRKWGMQTNAEVITQLLLNPGTQPPDLMENDEDDGNRTGARHPLDP